MAALKITIRRCRLAGGASQASQPSRPLGWDAFYLATQGDCEYLSR